MQVQNFNLNSLNAKTQATSLQNISGYSISNSQSSDVVSFKGPAQVAQILEKQRALQVYVLLREAADSISKDVTGLSKFTKGLFKRLGVYKSGNPKLTTEMKKLSTKGYDIKDIKEAFRQYNPQLQRCFEEFIENPAFQRYMEDSSFYQICNDFKLPSHMLREKLNKYR